jgi:hypothetical protein
MPLSKLVFKPGANRDQTNYASEGSWFDMDKVRFRSGFPEKIGGWVVQNQTPFIGVARSLFNWSTTNASDLTGIGTNVKMYVAFGTNISDITPLRTTLVSPATNDCVNTTDTSKVVTLVVTGHGLTTGDYVTISGVTGPTIGGIPIAEINAEHVVTVTNTSTFTITVTTAATSTASSQGGTGISIACQISPGFVSESVGGFGWGAGTWSRGAWGSGSTVPVFFPARLIFQDKFNNDLVFNIQYGNIYYWAFAPAFNTRAVLLSDIPGAVAVPQQVTKVLFSPQGFLLALGCTNYDASAGAPNYLGSYDPLLVRWSNVDPDIGPEPENWQPTLTNTAGFLRLQAGSQIVAGLSTKQEILIWTDISLTSLQFLGTSEVFGQSLIASNLSIAGPNVIVSANNVVYWMGNDKFYIYSGRVDTLPCTLRQYVFDNLNRSQKQIFFAGSNAEFNEVVWFYCSLNVSEIDSYVVYNYSENIWYFGKIHRTAWIDAGVVDYPLATNQGYIYEHELGHDDGQPLNAPPLPIESYIQSADIDIEDGDKYMLIRRIIPDVNFTNSELNNSVTGAPLTPEVTMTVGVRNFPGAASSTTNAEGESTAETVTVTGTTTATINQYTNQVFVRARGRQMNFKISSNGVGVQWQLGMPRVDARPDGLRN